MKQIYLTLLLIFSMVLSGQEVINIDHPKKNDTEIEGFKLYPNPAYGDVVYVTTKDNAHKDIVVYDVFGEVVLKSRITSHTLNISGLDPGVYVLQVTENKKTMTRKLVVK